VSESSAGILHVSYFRLSSASGIHQLQVERPFWRLVSVGGFRMQATAPAAPFNSLGIFGLEHPPGFKVFRQGSVALITHDILALLSTPTLWGNYIELTL
jgi:hypothetical protein